MEKLIYESKPYIFLMIGGYTLLQAPHSRLLDGSVFMLVAAAGIIIHSRRRYRRARAR